MTASEAWAEAKRRLTEDLGSSLADTVLFVDDELVTYDLPDRIRVRRTDLFELDDAGSWEHFLAPRPTWLHFNLLTVDPGLSVVTLRRSREAMAPDDDRGTPVNVSAERVRADVDEA